MTNIPKEQILSLIQDSIMTLKNKGKEFSTNPPLQAAWKNQNIMVQEAVKGLDLDDRRWLDLEFTSWSNNVLQADIDALPEVLRKKQDLS